MESSFYQNFYDIEKNHWLMRARRDMILDVLKKYSGEPRAVKILDFGCASGYFVSQLSEMGYDALGLDGSSEAIEAGNKKGVKNIHVISGQHIDFPDNTFDVVLLLDVIEHLEDESWALKEARRVLAPGGIMVITVPAYKFLWGVVDDVAHHFRRYTMTNLLKVVKKTTELPVIQKTYYNTLLFPPIASVRVVSRLLGIKGRESDFDLNNKFLDTVFFSIISFERVLLRYLTFPFGVAIRVVLQKPV